MRFGLEKDIGSLSGGDDKSVGFKWFHIDCINFNHGDSMVGYAEEELVIECCIDQPEEISLPRFHLQPKCICNKYNLYLNAPILRPY